MEVSCHDCDIEDRQLERYIPCCIKCWTCRSCEHNRCRSHCCASPPNSNAVLLSLEEASVAWSAGSVCILPALIMTLILFIVMAVETHDVISTYPCVTTMVWVSKDQCYSNSRPISDPYYDCLQSYRRLEWHHPQESMHVFSTNIAEASCAWSGQPTPLCNETSPILLKNALGWLNINVSCWIHDDTGAYYQSILVHGDDSPLQSTSKYFVSLLTFLGAFLCCCCVYTGSYCLGHQYRTRIILTRIDRHLYHSSGYAPFLLGLHHPTRNTPLESFVKDEAYDRSLSRLIGSFVTPNIQWSDVDQQIIEVEAITPLPCPSPSPFPPILTSSSINSPRLHENREDDDDDNITDLHYHHFHDII
jgi:hypothetical protein